VHLEPCRPRVLTDPTGAGDAFAGAFVTQYLATGDLIRSARHATALASFVVEEIGCWITMPSAESINKRISATWPST
jgi:sugar/nucleoside kinase (ribokinase family)